jgi:hypothetical protein
MKLLSLPKLRPSKPEQPRREPTLALYRDPFVGSGPCEQAGAVPDGLRQAVTESCPRCGAGGGMGTSGRNGDNGNGEAACILQSLELDLRLLDDESTTEALREVVGRLEPRLV